MYTPTVLEEDLLRSPTPPSTKHSPGPDEPLGAEGYPTHNKFKEPGKPFGSTKTTSSIKMNSSSPLKLEWPPRLYLAIDCGGTKAAAAICNEQGELIGRGQGGPANYTDIGLQSFLASVEDAVKSALMGAKMFYSNLESSSFDENGIRKIEWQPNSNRTTTQPQFTHSEEGIDSESDGIHSRPSTSGLQPGESGDEDDDRKCTHSTFSIGDALASIKPFSVPFNAPTPQFEAAWLGIAGVDSPADVTTLSPHLGKLLSIPYPGNRLIVANDTSLLASPIADSLRPEIKSGVVAIAGTGSIVMSFKRKRNGMLRVLGRVGGFGWLIGDEGSGYSVGRTAVRKVLDLTDRERLDIETASMMKETKLEEDSDSDDEVVDEEKEGIDKSEEIDDTMGTFDMDGPRRLSKDVSTTEESSVPLKSRAEYGHLLRDRILQHWGLVSTDELLRAVYFDEAHGGQPSGRGVPAAAKVSIVIGNNSSSSQKNCLVSITDHSEENLSNVDGNSTLSRSHNTIRAAEGISGHSLRNRLMNRFELPRNSSDSETTNSHRTDNRLSISPTRTSRTSLSSVPDEPSASLLPPSGPSLDVETRLHGVSPIPSLSSSPGSRYSTTFSDVFPSPTGALFASNSSTGVRNGNELSRIIVNNDDPMRSADSYSSTQSALQTELTSASSSISMPMSTGGSRDHSLDSVEAHKSVVGMLNSQSGTNSSSEDSITGNLGEGNVKDKPVEGKLRSTLERKHRLASLAPLVFHLAFTHKDECSLEILRSQAYFMALQISEICNVQKPTSRAFLNVKKSTLCLGGSLVGVEKYRELLVDELRKLGIRFARVEFVGDPAKRGALALSHVMERSRQQQQQQHQQ